MSKGLRFLACACMLLLGGCALPVPVQIAKWGIDGLVYLATDKTTADHGISLVVQRDCAMLWALTEGAICRDDAATMIASADDATAPTVTDAPVATDIASNATGEDVAREMAAFTTAAGESAPLVSVAAAETPDSVDSARKDPSSAENEPWIDPLPAILETTAYLNRLVLSVARIEFSGGNAPSSQEIYLGDVGHEPYLDGTYSETVLGGTVGDVLSRDDKRPFDDRPALGRSPPPARGHSWRRGRGSSGRRRRARRPGAGGRGDCGRGPPPRSWWDAGLAAKGP